MNNIVQLDFNDLQTVVKSCFREAMDEYKQNPKSSELPDRINLKEVMAITGYGDDAIYKMTMKGTIPHKKFGKKLVFSRKEILQWMQERTVHKQSPEDLASEHLAKVARKRINKSI